MRVAETRFKWCAAAKPHLGDSWYNGLRSRNLSDQFGVWCQHVEGSLTALVQHRLCVE